MGNKFLDKMVKAKDVKRGDYVLGHEITEVNADKDGHVILESYRDGKPSLYLQVEDQVVVLVTKAIKIPDSSCITCGERPVKYGQRLQCNTCYQRDRRSAQTAPSEEHFDSVAAALGSTYARELTRDELFQRRRDQITTS